MEQSNSNILELRWKYLIRTIYLVLVLSLIAIIISNINTITEQEKIIRRQEKLITKARKVDSTYTTKTAQYTDVITKYIHDCNFSIGGKAISTADLVSLVNKKFDENYKLRDSIYYLNQDLEHQSNLATRYMDSFIRCNYIVQDIKRHYGIDYPVFKENGKYYFSRPINKADSGLLLLRYYREKIVKMVDSGGSIYSDVMADKKR